MPDAPPRRLSEIDRTDSEHARLVIEQKLLPDPEARQAVLTLFANCMEQCQSKPAAWGLTLSPRLLGLNAGFLSVAQVRPKRMVLLVEKESLSPEAQEWIEEHGLPIRRKPKSQPGLMFVKAPTREASRNLRLFTEAVHAALRQALDAIDSRSLWWNSHSPGAISYIKRSLDRSLPEPDYSQGSGKTRYWKISPGAGADRWDEWRTHGHIAIGWPELGDLRRFESRDDFEKEREQIEAWDPHYTKPGAGQVWKFSQIQPGDRVIANRGTSEILGVGEVTGGYGFADTASLLPHRVPVRWVDTTLRDVEEPGWRRSLIELGKAKFTKLTKGSTPDPKPTSSFSKALESLRALGLHFPSELVADLLLALQTKRFVILTGISGTGKTRIALEVARQFRATIRARASTEVPDGAVLLTARPYMLKYGRVFVPVEILRELQLPPLSNTNSAKVDVDYPGGSAKLNIWKDPGRAVMSLLISGEVGVWVRKNVAVGDNLILEAPQDEEGGPFFRLDLPTMQEEDIVLDNARVIAVRPDWTDNRGLLGYFNPITERYVTTPFLDLLLEAQEECDRATKAERQPHPFFAILDEMNLARVEHYFSDFLSALESGEDLHLHDSLELEEGASEGPLSIPRTVAVPENLFFIGTVNVDESTYMFSPKVLDRAFTVEFNEVDLPGMAGMDSSDEDGLWLEAMPDGLPPVRQPRPEDWKELCEDHRDASEAIMAAHSILAEDNRHFGYRVANEIARFVLLAIEQAGDGARDVALDLAFLHKVLPKMHGTQQEMERLLDRLFAFGVLGEAPSDKDVERLREDEHWTLVSGGRLVRPEAAVADEVEEEIDEAEDEPAEGAPAPTLDTSAPVYPRTAGKLLRMRRRLQQQGFTSFIE